MTVALCQISGGYDSTAAAIMACEKYDGVHGVFFNYGQPYWIKEKNAAHAVDGFLSRKYNAWAGFTVMDLTLKCSHQGGAVPEYIPLRNLAMAVVSANVAQSMGIDRVVVGNKTYEHRPEDPYCFRDCSREFFDRVEALVAWTTEGGLLPVRFDMILYHQEAKRPRTKAEVLGIIAAANIPLDKLWTCYGAGPEPCGVCFHCVEEREALECIALKKQ